MDYGYINLKQLANILGCGRERAKQVMEHLKNVAQKENAYIPETKREILIPVHIVKKELKIKELKKL